MKQQDHFAVGPEPILDSLLERSDLRPRPTRSSGRTSTKNNRLAATAKHCWCCLRFRITSWRPLLSELMMAQFYRLTLRGQGELVSGRISNT